MVYKDIAPEDILRMEQEGKMENTRGDWRVTGYPHIDGEPEADHFRIGAVENNKGRHSDEHIAFVDGRGLKENEANAHLIAAAPNLLEACQHTLIWLSALIAQNENLKSGKRLAKIINEALAKAEGKQ